MSQVAQQRQAGKIIYPPQEDVFNAFRLLPLKMLMLMILGQDPYHGPNQAHGLSFLYVPVFGSPSLVNMYRA